MFKEAKKQRQMTKLEKRVSMMATLDLHAWAEQALYGIGRSLSSHQRTHADSDLDEAIMGAEALQVVVQELKARQ